MPKQKKPKRVWKLWQKILLPIACLILAAGIGFLAFPTVSNFFGQQRANGTIDAFNKTVENVIDENGEPEDDSPDAEVIRDRLRSRSFEEAKKNGEIDSEGYIISESGERLSSYPVSFTYDLDRLYKDSVAYNKSIINNQGTVDTSDYSRAALDMESYGLSYSYGYLSAPSIGLYMPVYLGANDYMMSCGAAHLAGPSLPVDMPDTNVAIAGHTGYIGRIFFDNIRNLYYGDTVSITNYWETIDYMVIDAKIVPFNQTDDIYIRQGRQLLTLITCTDNYHRYIVICEKI